MVGASRSLQSEVPLQEVLVVPGAMQQLQVLDGPTLERINRSLGLVNFECQPWILPGLTDRLGYLLGGDGN